MVSNLSQISLLTRREIEARIAGPLIRAFTEEFGEERVIPLAEKAILALAKEGGSRLASLLGGNSLEDFARGYIFRDARSGGGSKFYSAGDDIEFQLLERSPKKLSLNVTYCRFAQMYRELGISELGYIFSCGRDFAMLEGFNSNIRFTRTKTLMEGGDCCDFRLSLEP